MLARAETSVRVTHFKWAEDLAKSSPWCTRVGDWMWSSNYHVWWNSTCAETSWWI